MLAHPPFPSGRCLALFTERKLGCFTDWTQTIGITRLSVYMSTTPATISKRDRAALPMLALTMPIAMESFFRILVSSVDTFMLSSYSQEAVAAVGLISQYIFFIHVMFNVICIGTSIVLSQYLGAARDAEAKQVAQASAVMVTGVAIVLGIAVFAGGRLLLSQYAIDEAVRDYAWQYFAIFGGVGTLFMAFSLLQTTILRSHGYTRDAMYISLTANIINVIGNALALYGFFGLPVLGVPGVAAASVFSQLIACILLAIRIRKKEDVHFPIRAWQKVPGKIYKTILKIGVPTAGENLSYNIAQIVLMAMVSTLGTAAMSAMVYAQAIARFVVVIPISIGNATQIKTGYYVGAKRPEDAYRRVWKYQAIGTVLSLALILMLNLFKSPLIALFNPTPEIAALTGSLLLVSIYMETGRSINLITIPALKGAGDVRFPVFYGLFSMWLFMVFGAWILAFKLGLGLVGIWLAISTDETLRGIVMLLRWRSKRWMTKALA